jgi:DNA anti-recombination protein RmuC
MVISTFLTKGSNRWSHQLGCATNLISDGIPSTRAAKAIRRSVAAARSYQKRMGRQLTTASNSVESLGKRARVMSRKLKGVEMLSDQTTAEKLLGLDNDCAEIVDDIVLPVASEVVASAAMK